MCSPARCACDRAAAASADGAKGAAAESARKRRRSIDMTMSLPLCLPDSAIGCPASTEKISSAINDLIEQRRHVVHILRYALNRMKREDAGNAWRPGKEDFRLICSCQVHARQQRVWWRRGLRSMKNASTRAKSGMALLVGLPLAFVASWIPMDTIR